MRTGLATRAATMNVVAALVLFAGCDRADETREAAGPAADRSNDPQRELSGDPPSRTDEMRALGYSAWDDEAGSPPREAGVVLWSQDAAEEVSRAWADDRSSIHVVTPSGGEVRTINVPVHTQVEFARPLPGGRIIALSVDQGLTLLEDDGTVVWQRSAPCHHEVVVVPRPGDRPGARLFAVALHRARGFAGREVRFDEVAFWEEATGAESKDTDWQPWSTWEHRAALDRAVGGAPHALSVPPKDGAQSSDSSAPVYDYFHLNGIAFDGQGTMIVCLRNVSLVAEVSLPSGDIARSLGPGVLDWPHAPSCVQSQGGESALLVFDNGAHRGWSRVVELNRRTGEVIWEWRGTKERPLWSRVRGFAERLPGGHTLVTESERGRAFEVTPSGEVVWEFQNPEMRSRDNGLQRRRIYRMTSVPLE